MVLEYSVWYIRKIKYINHNTLHYICCHLQGSIFLHVHIHIGLCARSSDQTRQSSLYICSLVVVHQCIVLLHRAGHRCWDTRMPACWTPCCPYLHIYQLKGEIGILNYGILEVKMKVQDSYSLFGKNNGMLKACIVEVRWNLKILIF